MSNVIKPALTAYQIFQKEFSSLLKGDHPGDPGGLARAIGSRWQSLDPSQKKKYEDQARSDKFRFMQESHARDIEALRRQEQKRQEREALLDNDDSDDDDGGGGGAGRRTRSSRQKTKACYEEKDEDEDESEEENEEDDEHDQESEEKSVASSDAGGDHYGRGGGSDSSEFNVGSSDDEDIQNEAKVKGKKSFNAPVKKKKTNEKWNSDASESSFSEDEEDSEQEPEAQDEDSDEQQDEEPDDSEEEEDDDDEDSDSEPPPPKRRKVNVKPKKATPKHRRIPSSSPSPSASPPPPPKVNKLSERRQKTKWAKEEKDKYIEKRQGELRKDRADQAKRRLEFLLKQSDIFAHFGNVKEDKAKFHSTRSTRSSSGEGTSQRNQQDSSTGEDPNQEQEVTYLTSQPSTLANGTMRSYQLEGLNWMLRLQENGVNGILADEMGLGKTLQSISILVYMQEYRNCTGPHLVIVPKSTLSNWMNEFGKWAPTLTPIRFHGNKEEREEILKEILIPAQRDEDRHWDVCLTTYEICNLHKNTLNKFAWSYLIIDEAHRLKNETSAFAQTVRAFETRYRLLLTGTPLQNNLHELWALLNFLVPDVFASADQFDEWFNLDIDDAEEKGNLIRQLHKILRPFMMRRLKVDVEKSLPPKHETILYTGMSVMQKKMYKDILLRDVDALQDGNRTALLNIVMQLRKCAGHPYLFPGVEDRSLPPLGEHLIENCGKMVLLDKLLIRLNERGHRVLLFTQMTRILDILEDYMVMRRYKYCRIDGNRSYEEREDSIDAFNAPDSDIFAFLLSTRAGGLGINLQTADVVILYDSDWNPQADLQAQDRAHRIGQKREVQVFRLVTQDTIEEKIVERAQQKLKLDAVVVQQGRLKEKDKLSRGELLEAVRFGADKVFKSMDTDITDDDIDMILNIGKKKTQALNEKLQEADKGDMLDFKLDGGSSSAQTFEGVDYSQHGKGLAQVRADQAQVELLAILDMGKRGRSTVSNYNEEQMHRRQMAGLGVGDSKKEKKKKIRLPKALRLPKMEEFQMYDREELQKINEEEESAFGNLPPDVQKNALATKTIENEMGEFVETGDSSVLPSLLSEERLSEKEKLLDEGFSDWTRNHYNVFVKASAKYGRYNYAKIALDVEKSPEDIEAYANAFWDEDIGKKRFSEYEYERVVKIVEKGEKKLEDLSSIQRCTSKFLSIFNNPWIELEFTHVNCKDKMFTAQEDRHLLCWAHKYGYGNWNAIKFAIRRSPTFRFDYFLKSLPVESIGRRCEQLMKAAEKEVEQLENEAREEAGLTVNENDFEELPEIQLPSFKEMVQRKRAKKEKEIKNEETQLQKKVDEIQEKIVEIQERIKFLNQHAKENGASSSVSKTEFPEALLPELVNIVARSGSTGIMTLASQVVEKNATHLSKRQVAAKIDEIAVKEKRETDGNKIMWYIKPDFMHLVNVSNLETKNTSRKRTSLSVSVDTEDDDTLESIKATPFPKYDGTEPPKESRKAFTMFCNATRKEVKATLDPGLRKDKNHVNSILKEKWYSFSTKEKEIWKQWQNWDESRYEHELKIYNDKQREEDTKDSEEMEGSIATPPITAIPKKKRSVSDYSESSSTSNWSSIPKKMRS